ncbi:DUF4157 domain-containing protein [Actinospica durhamensis]|uniref:DUF4157 domain-containing protein n=1 Tax=Actinospica durhamensis TaxID=1508375 RepID=A0A941ETS0_9ACTN|nr:LamG-like jellyroll fold domain-containing protein [Actinospica durhamensis]MBR7837151.1 DUF4157 domain-containing protein [Actinospica durhamensis]
MAMATTARLRLDRARHARHESGQLPARLREQLERALDADLSAVRVYTGPAADAAARAFGADAVASGSALFFRRGAFDPGSRDGVHLVAHEVAHTVQQAALRAGSPARLDRAVGEAAADRFADAFTAAYADGGSTDGSLAALALPHGRGGHDVLRVAAGPSGMIQLHSSFEHRYLGDGDPQDLRIIAENRDTPTRDRLLQGQIKLFELFDRKDPEHVTRADILRVAPHIQTLELGPDKIVATLGEINALPDYLSHPDQVESVRHDVLLPILQVIRQEGYNQFTELLTGHNPYKRFPGSPFQPTGALWGIVEALRETNALDELTAGLGIAGQDHYKGLLARNACHFAPYSWYRWLSFHLMARQAATDAFKGGKTPQLVQRAWNLAGYADHFLEDSFAAGHLIDKTLVMQWFVDWAQDTDLVADQSVLRYMTAALQPGLAAGRLYDPAYTGPSHDPQTVQELHTEAARISGTKLGPGREDGTLGGYLDYLTFLTSAAAQLGTNLLHNHYNDNSVWASSAAHTTPYQLWGDGTLLSEGGATGAFVTASAAQLSRRAIQELIDSGTTAITTTQIRSHFPTSVGSASDKLTTIGQWATTQRPFVEETIFKGFKDEIGKLLTRLTTPSLGIVSRDEPLGQQFATRADSDDSIIYEEAAVLPVGDRLFAASRGYVYELDPVSGAKLHGRAYALPEVLGSRYSTLASDGKMLFVGISSHVHALPLDGPWEGRPGWVSPTLGGLANLRFVTLLTNPDGRLFAASHGYVYELDPQRGAIKQEVELGSKVGVAEYPVDLATDGDLLYAGTHGYVYAINLRGPWNGWLWYSAKLGVSLDHQPVAVLVHGKRLFAMSDGVVYELPRDGSEKVLQRVDLHHGRWSPYIASLATDGGQLFVGTRGVAYALPLGTKWGENPTWSSPALSNIDEHGPVSLVCLRDRLFAGADGYVYELDLLDGAIRQQWQLVNLTNTGLDLPTVLVPSHEELYVGVHGYAYGMLLAAIQPTPTAAWPLAPVTGTGVPDRRGIHPATSFEVQYPPLTGLGGYALFNGVNSKIDTAAPVLDTTAGRGFTVDAWVRLDASPAAANSVIVAQTGTLAAAFTLGYSRTGTSWYLERTGADENSPIVQRVYAGVDAVLGVWTRVSGVYDPDATDAAGKTPTLSIYVDGAFAKSLVLSAPMGYAARGPLQIGVGRVDGRDAGPLKGAVRDVRVYGEALDAARLEPRAASFWRLDERGGTVAADRRHHHEARATDVNWTRIPDVGRGAHFNGRSTVIATKGPVVNAARGGSFTVAAWVRQDTVGAVPEIALCQNGQNVPVVGLRSRMATATSLSWTFFRYAVDSVHFEPVVLDSGTPVVFGTWAHVAGVYDAATQNMHIYVDGVRRGSAVFPRDHALDATGTFMIGHGAFADGRTQWFSGIVRDVRAYNEALTENQVRALLVAGAAKEDDAA